MDACGDCGSVFSSLGFPPTSSASALADVLQFVATKMESVLGRRMVLAVVCGPREGVGGYVLHGTGVAECTSDVALDAVASSVDGMVQALQVVAASTSPRPRPRNDGSADASLVDGRTPARPEPPPSPRPGKPAAPTPLSASPPTPPARLPQASSAPPAPSSSAAPLAQPRPEAPPAGPPTVAPLGGLPPVAPSTLPGGAGGGSVSGGGQGGAAALALRPPLPRPRSPAQGSSFPVLIPWLTKLPPRLQLPSLVDGVTVDPPAATAREYIIPATIVKQVTDALTKHNTTRAGALGARLFEFMSLYLFNVAKRTGIRYTFENATPDVARGATVVWQKGKRGAKITEAEPRFANNADFKVPRCLAVVLLMVHLNDTAFMSLLRHFQGGAVIGDAAPSQVGKKRKAGKALTSAGVASGGAGADANGVGREDLRDGVNVGADSGGRESGGTRDNSGGDGATEGGGVGDMSTGDRDTSVAARGERGGASDGRGGGGLAAGGGGGEAGAAVGGGGVDVSAGDRVAGVAARAERGGSSDGRGGGGLAAGGGGGEAATTHRGGGLGPSGREGGASAGPRGRGRGRGGWGAAHKEGARGGANAASAAAAAAAARSIEEAERKVAFFVASAVYMDGALVGTGSICPGLADYHGAAMRSDVVSVFLGQLAPGASCLQYPFALDPEYCLEPRGAGPGPTTLAHCANMTRSVWTVASIG